MKSKNYKSNKTNFKKENKYDMGGVLNTASSLAPLLSLAGPYGQAAGAALNIGSSIYNVVDAKNKAKQEAMIEPYRNPSNYSNRNAFGYNMGGSLDALAQGAFKVNANPNQTDAMKMNYKGQNIRLDNNETFDTEKERVISDDIMFNKTKSFADVDKKYKRARGKSEKENNKQADALNQNTIDFMKTIENDLFVRQEIKATQMGLRNEDGSTVQNEQTYNTGGPLDMLKSPYNNPQNQSYLNKYAQVQRTRPVPQIANYDQLGSYWTNPKTGAYEKQPQLSDRLSLLTGASPDVSRIMLGLAGKSPEDQNKLLSGFAKANNGDYIMGQPKQVRDIDPEGQEYQKTIMTPNYLKSNTMPDLSVLNQKNQVTDTPTNNPNLWNRMTLGEKVSSVSGAASLIGKTIESLQPLKKAQRYSNTAGISLNQLDPSYALTRNNQSYKGQLSDLSNMTNTFAQRNTLNQALFANKLNSDNNILNSYNERNMGLKQDYENRLERRNEMEIQRNQQADEIDEQNRGRRQNMRMGVLSDIATYGENLGNMFNTQQATAESRALMGQIAPDVMGDLMASLDTILNRNKTKKNTTTINNKSE